MKKIVIVTENKYPGEDAGALRQHATAKMLKELGYDVIIIGYGKTTGRRVKTYEGINYISFRPATDNIVVRLVYRVVFGYRALRFIRKNHSDASAILVIDTLPYAMRAISDYARRKNLTLIHDSVEWYSPEEYPDGVKNRQYRFKEQTNCEIVGKGWRVMAISRYLQEHFEKVCDRVVRIPVIMDTNYIDYRTEIGSDVKKIRFVYAGAPARKDYIKEIIEGFCLLKDSNLNKLELHILGVNKQQLVDMCGVNSDSIKAMGDSLIVHGRVPHEEAVRWVREADYTLLIRDAELRYAKAGFPTKIVESLSCGTPPVCNLSSDLELYLKDGENAIIAEGNAPEQVKKALEAAMAISIEERKNMRKKARETAETHFDYHRYVSVMGKLVE